MPASMERELVRNDLCFVCGKNNRRGLRLSFAYPEPGRAETSCSIPEHFSGWQRMTHGGLLATLLDEAMAHACISREGPAVTVELTVRFLKPVEVGQAVLIRAEVREVKGRVLEAQGEVLDSGGEAVARGSGRFLKV
jgi:uncharacterized protein (TIGR00369 family)